MDKKLRERKLALLIFGQAFFKKLAGVDGVHGLNLLLFIVFFIFSK